jgi:anti-sigma-K factor RskA
MIRQKLDEYLDGALAAGERAEVERLIASDPAAATLLERMQAERALRTAVFTAYAPTVGESRHLAASMLAACHDAPVGRIGIWIKRSLGVAAAVGILAGTFALGRFSSPQAKITASVEPSDATTPTVFVLYNDESGEPTMKEFTSIDDALAFQKQASDHHGEAVAVASRFDAEHPGSF